jgi:LacI family transcriptional regulator
VTIRTVAGDAGVSVAAVSKVLRNAYGVSEALRSKVLNSIAVYGQREVGYLGAMARAGLAERARVIHAHEHPPEAEDDMRRILGAPDLPSAIFCWSDIHAVPLVNMARPMGIEVPERLATIGYDNTPASALRLVGLSSVDQDADRLGEIAGSKLLSRIDGRSAAEHVLLPPTLVRRASF